MNTPTQAAALRIASAWNDGTLFDVLPDSEKPGTVEEAYYIQGLLLDQLKDEGAGWKIAGASRNTLRSGLEGLPMFGFLRQSRLMVSDAVLAMPDTGVLTLELEIAVRFGRTVLPHSEAFEESMLSSVFLAFEVVRSRFRDRKKADRPSLIADDVGFHSFVSGDALAGGMQSTLLSAPATISCDAAPIGAALEGDDRVDTVYALELFWSHASARQWTVPEGSIITTGVIAKPVDAKRPGLYEGRLGDSSVRLLLR